MNGAPGPALVYLLASLLLLEAGREGVARSSLLCHARWAWAGVWCLGAALVLFAPDRSAPRLVRQVDAAVSGGPSWLTATGHAWASAVASAPGWTVAGGAVVGLIVGLAGLCPRTGRAALVAGLALATFWGIAAQGLGRVFAADATDPGMAPALLLLALTAWAPKRSTGELGGTGERGGPAAAAMSAAGVDCDSGQRVPVAVDDEPPGAAAPVPVAVGYERR